MPVACTRQPQGARGAFQTGAGRSLWVDWVRPRRRRRRVDGLRRHALPTFGRVTSTTPNPLQVGSHVHSQRKLQRRRETKINTFVVYGRPWIGRASSCVASYMRRSGASLINFSFRLIISAAARDQSHNQLPETFEKSYAYVMYRQGRDLWS